MAGIFWLLGEGSHGNFHTKDVGDHVGAKPANQRGAAGGVVGLAVVEEETIDLQPEKSELSQ